jgi:hypothetical protein
MQRACGQRSGGWLQALDLKTGVLKECQKLANLLGGLTALAASQAAYEGSIPFARSNLRPRRYFCICRKLTKFGLGARRTEAGS